MPNWDDRCTGDEKPPPSLPAHRRTQAARKTQDGLDSSHTEFRLVKDTCRLVGNEMMRRTTKPRTSLGSVVVLCILLSTSINCSSGQETTEPSPLFSSPTIVPTVNFTLLAKNPTAANSTVTPTLAPSAVENDGESGNRTFAPAMVNSTVSPASSPFPTSSPIPSALPSSAFPTFVAESMDKGFYRQDFVMENEAFDFFNETEQATLVSIFNSYTVNFAPEPNKTNRISTQCHCDDQRKSRDDFNRSILSLDYSCLYTSKSVNVTGFPLLFYAYVGNNLLRLKNDMQGAGLTIRNALELEFQQILSPAPTTSMQPSSHPTMVPSISALPSVIPSPAPSTTPTLQQPPTTPPMFLLYPTTGPVAVPMDNGERLAVGAIAAIVILAGMTFLLLLFWYYRSWSKKRELEASRPHNELSSSGGASASTIFTPRLRVSRPSSGRKASTTDSQSLAATGSAAPQSRTDSDDERGTNTFISPTDSLLSNKSLLSVGDSGLVEGSGDENDGTKNLQDEFDQYRDKNLEQLREDVEGNLSGFENIMSAAVTNALMGDEETNVDMQDLLWGCNANPDGTEIEASALFEVSDWLKRNETAGADRKRAFMQEILNKMVTSVRYGVIVAEDASRTIHESAAILGLQLAEELPMTTVLISGMRKMTTAEDMKRALHEFGEIDQAAVASGKRGFGIVRFRRRKSVDQALQRYKSGEIVILDVSIQMKVIMPSGVVESR
jgi:hypothetical protein